MPSIQKLASGYRAQVFVGGVRDSRSFRTRREAVAWAEARESELRGEAAKPVPLRHTMGDAMREYEQKAVDTKRGRRWDRIRLKALADDDDFPSGELLGNLTPEMFAKWRDARLKVVSAGTVLRDMSLVSAVIEMARREWRWLDGNPLREIRKPRSPDHRQVIITRAQIRIMLKTMGYSPRRPVRSVAQSVAVCFLVALRTGMRAGELCGLTWDRVAADHCTLPLTKTVPRQVPFDLKVVRLLGRMRDYDPLLVFGMKSASLDANFRKYRDRAKLSGFTFHDSRHTAATWLARRLDVLDLCRMFGWSNPKMAMTYYNPSASSIAALLNTRRPGQPRAPGQSR